MITIIFWNINHNAAVLTHLACLLAEHQVDLFLLAECPKDVTPALAALNNIPEGGSYRVADNEEAKVRALTRLPLPDLIHHFTGLARDLAVWRLRASKVGPAGEVLLAGVHLPSKAGGVEDTDQATVAKEVIEDLNGVEDKRGHRYTALIGDFNMNPYDSGMTSATAVHALMTSSLANRPDRVFRKVPRRRFYNPMWGLLGDRTPGPAGSYYWDAYAPHNPYWATFDQVLLRIGLVEFLADLRILSSDGTHSLVRTDDLPDAEEMSDHLPLLVRLDV